MLRYEIEPTQFVLRVYDDKSQDNYVASALIRTYGDRAYMSSISSPRLFDAMPQHFDDLMERLGLVTLEGYMTKAMARAVRMASRGWALFTVTHTGMCAGRQMEWVVIGRLPRQSVETPHAQEQSG